MNPDDRYVSSQDARDHLRDLLNQVEHDSAHIFVLRYRTPAAVIVPVEWYEQVRARLNGKEK